MKIYKIAQNDQNDQTKQNDPMSVAKTILQQLGGNKFLAMTGAKNLIGSANSLSFKLPCSGGFTKNGINTVRITLEPSDTYTVEFGKIRGTKYTVISKLEDVYFDDLQELFTRETGLNTSL